MTLAEVHEQRPCPSAPVDEMLIQWVASFLHFSLGGGSSYEKSNNKNALSFPLGSGNFLGQHGLVSYGFVPQRMVSSWFPFQTGLRLLVSYVESPSDPSALAARPAMFLNPNRHPEGPGTPPMHTPGPGPSNGEPRPTSLEGPPKPSIDPYLESPF